MDIKTTVLAAATLGLCLGAQPAQAQSQGILACQIMLSQFADDVTVSKGRLNGAQLTDARNIVDVGRSQCRSTPDLVMTDVRVARSAFNLQTGRRAGDNFTDFWPARPDELALLSR